MAETPEPPDPHDPQCGCPECWEPPDWYQIKLARELGLQLSIEQIFEGWEPPGPEESEGGPSEA